MIGHQSQSNDSTVQVDYIVHLHIRKFHFWLVILICVGVYLWLVSRTIFTFWHNTHTNPFPRNHVLATEKIPGCQQKLGTEYSLGSDGETFRTRTYWKQMLLLDPSAIAHNRAAILGDPACLGARIQGLMEVPFPVNYYVLRDMATPPLLFLHKD